MVAVFPGGTEELGALHDNLGEMDAFAGGYLLGKDMDAGTQAEYQARVFPVEDNVPASKEHLPGGRHHNGTVCLGHVWVVSGATRGGKQWSDRKEKKKGLRTKATQ
jgi:hypothetical protein